MIRNFTAEKAKEKKDNTPPKYIKDPKTKIFIMNTNVGIFEAKILHFIYSYIFEIFSSLKKKTEIYNNDN